MCLFLTQSNKSQYMLNFLWICVLRREKMNVPKKVFLTTNISELLSGPISVKYKDPECPTISWTIGQIEISRSLLDLGASINLLPLSVYQQFGLGVLRPTRVTIQLVDWSMKVPKGKSQMSLIGSGISSTLLTSSCLRPNLCQTQGLKLLLF